MTREEHTMASWARNWAAYALLCWATALDAWAERLVGIADRLIPWPTVLDQLDHADRYSQARDLIDSADHTPTETAA
jgi:hypothetical protein